MTDRIRSTVQHWIHCRMQECVRCRECDSTVTPWASLCPRCGQANPARVSPAAGVYLALAFVLVTSMLLALKLAF